MLPHRIKARITGFIPLSISFNILEFNPMAAIAKTISSLLDSLKSATSSGEKAIKVEIREAKIKNKIK